MELSVNRGMGTESRISCCLSFSGTPLQKEGDNGYDNEDYYEPSCDFHRETGYPFHAHNEKHQGKDQEDNCKVD